MKQRGGAAASASEPYLEVDVSRRGTIRAQLLARIRTAIHDQHLPAGSRLPSTRSMAERLGIARSTVTEVFDQLLSEGYVVARHGAGTYVSPARRDTTPRVRASGVTAWERVSRRGKLFADRTTRSRYVDKEPRAFQAGIPAVDLFPFATWSRIAARLLRNPPRELVAYGDPGGFRALREAIAAHVRERKRIACDAAQIIVTSGTQQSLDIVNRLVLDPEDEVWFEEPGSLAARSGLTSAGARLIPVPVDREGMDVAAARRAAPRARLAFVTAANQWPTHVPLSPARRAELLAWAESADAWIVEDDYDSAFRYAGNDPAPLRADAGADRVLWIGSFSLTTFPALRIGYVVAPHALVDAFVAAKAATDRQGPTVEQAVLAEFMLGGHYARHLRAMHDVYAERRGALRRCLEEYLPTLAWTQPPAGLHGVLALDGYDDVAVARAAGEHGVSATPLSPHFIGRARRSGLVLGFGIPSPGEIRIGVRKLRDAVRSVRR